MVAADGHGIHTQLTTDRGPICRVSLHIDFVIGAVTALEGNDEPAVGQHGNVVIELTVGGGRIDLELDALGVFRRR